MSVKAMGAVWDILLEPAEKFVLLAYADHAEHDGTNIYPAVEKVAKKTGYSERQVQRITRRLEKAGALIPDGKGPRGTKKWRIPVPTKGDIPDVGGDNLSPEGVTSTTFGGDIAMTPEPSLTVLKDKERAHEKDVRLRALFTAISKTCQTDPKTARASIGKVASVLLKAEYTPDDVAAFDKWWWGDKKMRLRPPKVWQLQEQIGVIRQPKHGEVEKDHDYFVPPSMRVIDDHPDAA